jgi:hypothetical protein
MTEFNLWDVAQPTAPTNKEQKQEAPPPPATDAAVVVDGDQPPDNDHSPTSDPTETEIVEEDPPSDVGVAQELDDDTRAILDLDVESAAPEPTAANLEPIPAGDGQPGATLPKSDSVLGRPLRASDGQAALFHIEPDWKDVWWGMPTFDMRDARPQYKISVNFMTAADVAKFAEVTGCPVSTRSDSAWYPPQQRLHSYGYCYEGPKTESRYPVCLPSKGRAKYQSTGRLLQRLGVTHRFFVEETEYEEYCEHVGADRVVKMPFHDLGQGSIPARNFIWEWAKERGHKRHWCVDDNIVGFRRADLNRRMTVKGGGFFLAMEDFVDRYENIAFAGPHNQGFMSDRAPNQAPYLFNSRVYSCILINTELPYRWRGRYNEDTDISLRALKDGWCTLLFRALLMDKGDTLGARNARPMPGGNTDNVYNTGDGRKAFAESLKAQHPDVVSVVWRFNRWHHHVDYSPFKNNRPIMRANVTQMKSMNNYGMTLVEAKEAADAELTANETVFVEESADEGQPQEPPVS